MTRRAPYGTWASPISLDLLVQDVVGLSFPTTSLTHVYWAELRPDEGGRQVVVRMPTDDPSSTEEVFGPQFHARTLVHEYGGLPYAVSGHTVYFSNFSDQRLYRVDPGGAPVPLTPEPPTVRSIRYAAPVVTPDGRHLLAVRETHPDPDLPADVVNDIVALPTDGSSAPMVLGEGHDFFSHLSLSPDGRRLAWVSWDHPDMPWDGTELWEAEIGSDMVVTDSHKVAGGPGESVIQAKYSAQGGLVFVSDRTGWWNLYAAGNPGEPPLALAPMDADLGEPDWVFGTSSYALLADGSVVGGWSDGGLGRLGVLRPGGGHFDLLETPFTSFAYLQPTAGGASLVAIAGAADSPTAVVRITVAPRPDMAEAAVEVLKRGHANVVDRAFISIPEAIEFPTEGDLTAHALYYPPRNPDFEAPSGELPPLIVASHGGPTSAARSALNYGTQFWTSRGIAVVDVNYGGSTGFGREYRERLRDNWGIVDLDDCVNAALFLAASGRADRRRLLIHGGSAGGYTTLCAVTFRDVFAAGASYFGVADAGALARETHKFESRYLDNLIGPWPEAEATYRQRSPLFHTDRLRTPLILFQGLEDMVVPPGQAEAMAKALDEKGIPFAYVAYPGEQHGFRQAQNIKRTTEAELYFYGRVLGFTPADTLTPVEIHHEDRLAP